MATRNDDGLVGAQPPLHASTEFSPSSPDTTKDVDTGLKSEGSSLYDVKASAPLAPAEDVGRSAGRAILEGLGIWKKSNKIEDLDAVCSSIPPSLL
jgi:hypothetical protein